MSVVAAIAVIRSTLRWKLTQQENVMSLEEMTKIDNLKSWTSGVDIDWDTVKQLRNIAELPILAGHVAVMPDVHLGKGATVGSVIPTKGAIIPAAVGVDIGCSSDM
jgi:RNA-splicing ligase RtcB